MIGVRYDSSVQETTETIYKPRPTESKGLGVLWLLTGSETLEAAYHMSKGTEWEEVTEKNMKLVYTINIEVLKSKVSAEKEEKQRIPVWSGSLNINAKYFDKHPKFCLSKLFNYYGSENRSGVEFW